jgi:hypothetical protein
MSERSAAVEHEVRREKHYPGPGVGEPATQLEGGIDVHSATFVGSGAAIIGRGDGSAQHSHADSGWWRPFGRD